MPPFPEADDLIAAELALGLLDAPEREDAQRRLSTDPAFAAAHRRWQDRATALFAGPDVAPPGHLWAAIARRLPANDQDAAERTLGARLRRWQLASMAATVLAIVSTGALLARRGVPASPKVVQVASPASRPLVAMLASADRPTAIAISYDPLTRRLTAIPSRLALGGHAAELWVIPAGGAPQSLGVVAAQAPTARVAPRPVAALIGPGATLAISVEPAGGSQTGRPTGPVILTGSVTAT